MSKGKTQWARFETRTSRSGIQGVNHLATHTSKDIKVCTLNSRLPAAVWPLKHCKTSPVFQSHIPTVLSNDAVMTLSSSKQISAHVWVFRTYTQCPVVKSQSLTDRSSDPTKRMTSGESQWWQKLDRFKFSWRVVYTQSKQTKENKAIIPWFLHTKTTGKSF